MPNLTKDIVLRIAQEVLADRQLSYDNNEGFRVRFDGLEKLRDGQWKSIWTVGYLTSPGFIDQRDHFILIDDTSGKLEYIITSSGYIE